MLDRLDHRADIDEIEVRHQPSLFLAWTSKNHMSRNGRVESPFLFGIGALATSIALASYDLY